MELSIVSTDSANGDVHSNGDAFVAEESSLSCIPKNNIYLDRKLMAMEGRGIKEAPSRITLFIQ